MNFTRRAVEFDLGVERVDGLCKLGVVRARVPHVPLGFKLRLLPSKRDTEDERDWRLWPSVTVPGIMMKLRCGEEWIVNHGMGVGSFYTRQC